jgi:hypothetical protein
VESQKRLQSPKGRRANAFDPQQSLGGAEGTPNLAIDRNLFGHSHADSGQPGQILGGRLVGIESFAGLERRPDPPARLALCR